VKLNPDENHNLKDKCQTDLEVVAYEVYKYKTIFQYCFNI